MLENPVRDEKRRAPRFPCPIPCLFQGVRAVLGNISVRGAFLRVQVQVRQGENVALSFTLVDRHFADVPARVAWVRPAGFGYDCGLEFPEAWAEDIRQAILHPSERRILIVEPDAALRGSLERSLLSAGYLPTGVESAAQARKAREKTRFDLVVDDLEKPVNHTEFLLRVAACFRTNQRSTPA